MNEIDYRILQSNYNDLVGKYVSLEQENQKLKDLLDLAMGAIEFYADHMNYDLDTDSFINDRIFNDLTGSGCGSWTDGKRARATREEILKQMEGM